MRRPLLVPASGVAVAAAIAVGFAVAGPGSAASADHTPAPASHSAAAFAPRLPGTLAQQLQRFLGRRPLAVRPAIAVPRNLQPSAPTVCFVASGSCSLTPCVEFARGAGQAIATSGAAQATATVGAAQATATVGAAQAIATVSGPAVLRTAIPVRSGPSGGAAVLRSGGAVPRAGCGGRRGTPHVLRVSGP